MVREVKHAAGSTVRLLRNPIRYSETPIEDYTAPPLVGQDTEAVLAGLGLGPDAIADLRAAKAI
jgi:crotonobetainyl-CoA:carnitine CoA-transferase CaiB-like acyl-CoA transferase